VLTYIINERLKRIVEQTNALEPGQGRRRQVQSVNMNMKQIRFDRHADHRQNGRVYQADIDFRNAFNATSQASLWHVMKMFHLPDVDLLEQIYNSTTVCLAPNNAESATITFNTGVKYSSEVNKTSGKSGYVAPKPHRFDHHETKTSQNPNVLVYISWTGVNMHVWIYD